MCINKIKLQICQTSLRGGGWVNCQLIIQQQYQSEPQPSQMINKDTKNLMSCIDMIDNQNRHSHQLKKIKIYGDRNHQMSPQYQRKQYLNHLSLIHLKATVMQNQERNRQIETSNYQLVRKIKNAPSTVPRACARLKKMRSASQINRQREQRRIDAQNLQLKKRIVTAESQSSYSQSKIKMKISRVYNKSAASRNGKLDRNYLSRSLYPALGPHNFSNLDELLQPENQKSQSLNFTTSKLQMNRTPSRSRTNYTSKPNVICSSRYRVQKAALLNLRKRHKNEVITNRLFMSQTLENPEPSLNSSAAEK